jgi:hypothetical protein
MTVEERLDLMVKSLQGMERKLERWKEQSTEVPSKPRRKRPGPFKAQPKRACNPARTDVLVSDLDD